MEDKSDSTLSEQLERLRQSFKERLPNMLDAIHTHWSELKDRSAWDQESVAVLKKLFIAVHRITGSAGSFGFSDISHAAFPLEELLRQLHRSGSALTAEERDQIDVFIKSLLQTWEEGAQEPLLPLEKPIEPGSEGIYLIAKDLTQADFVVRQLESFGYKVYIFTGPTEVRLAMDAALPTVIIADLRTSNDKEFVDLQWLERLCKKVPVIVLSSRSDMATRLAAVRAKCVAYLEEPLEIDELVYWLNRFTQRAHIEPYRILIVDDDTILAQTYGSILRSAGMDIRVLSEPLKILEALAEQPPDLILLDIYMPECNGIDLAQVIRQHRAYMNIPIIFLSVERDFQRQLVAKRLGGDEFLTKPIIPDHLIAAVSVWVAQSSALRTAMESDSMTGLLNHASFKERLAVELARAQRQQLSLAFALLDLDHFKLVNDHYGHLTGDRVLKTLSNLLTRRLRKTDFIGRYGGEEFAVILPHTPLNQATKIMDEIRESFAAVQHPADGQHFTVTLSGGIASYEGEGNIEANDLVDIADKALYQGKTMGGNRVVKVSESRIDKSVELGP